MKQVTANVYVEIGFPGANVGIVTTRDGIVMIDAPMCPTDAMKWREEISRRGEVRYLINTDEHNDHNLCNYFFPGVVISHRGTRETLLNVPVDEVVGLVKAMDPGGLPLMEGYQKKLPDITFTESLTLYLGDHTFDLINLPGHVPGMIGVYIPEERVVFVSDNVYCREKTWAHVCTPELWYESLKRIGRLDADAIIPGHGDAVCGKGYLEEQASIIRRWVEVVKSAIEQGLSEEEAIPKISCPDPYPLPKIYLPIMTEPELNRHIIHRLYHVLGSQIKAEYMRKYQKTG